MPDEAAPDAPAPEEPAAALVIDGALHSREEEAPWSVAWGKLPPGATSVRVSFHAGRRSQPAARVGVIGRHWAAEAAGRFDKVKVFAGHTQVTGKIRIREKPAARGFRRKKGTEHADPLERMKQRWGLAAVILQPGGEDRPELPDIRSAGD